MLIMKNEITLYGTSACHLCEEAFEIIQPTALANNLTITHIDIADDDALMEEFGLYIPVVTAPNGEFLRWPFDTNLFDTFLANNKS
jgi:sulfur relay (sulfurtransferase) DsrF/TusC family protein